jgi:formate hydrogenlyase subunit 3/multisubunit Na+/H+ antiporter MnhD subunit
MGLVWLVGILTGVIVLGGKGGRGTRAVVGLGIVVGTVTWLEGGCGLVGEWDWWSEGEVRGKMMVGENQVGMYLLTGVSAGVWWWGEWYMGEDSRGQGLVGWLMVFSGAMGLVMEGLDMVTLVVGWEGIGYASYRLIGYQEERGEASRAGVKAVAWNRLGDIGMVMALAGLVGGQGDGYLGTAGSGWEGVGILAGVWSKSAQVGMQGWLLDAMEGPTPVSSLLHSATLVCAGIVMLEKGREVWTGSEIGVVVMGGVTAIVGTMGALGHMDIKRVIAYSTMVHVGVMVCGVGAGGESGEHMLMHGLGKAGLFMVVGGMLHEVQEQDVRRVTGKGLAAGVLGAIMLGIGGQAGTAVGASKEWLLERGGQEAGDIAGTVGAITIGSVAYSIGTWTVTGNMGEGRRSTGGRAQWVYMWGMGVGAGGAWAEAGTWHEGIQEATEVGTQGGTWALGGLAAWLAGIGTTSEHGSRGRGALGTATRRHYWDRIWAMGALKGAGITAQVVRHIEYGLWQVWVRVTV